MKPLKAIEFEMYRNEPFFTLTLFLPIVVLTLLSPIGLILPGNYSNQWLTHGGIHVLNFTEAFCT